jgi:hypothetical protein
MKQFPRKLVISLASLVGLLLAAGAPWKIGA